MDSLYSELKCEFDSDHFVARRLQREEDALRLQEEEKNLLALTKLLMKEEDEEKKRKKSEQEDSHKVALELQRQWERDVDCNSFRLQRQKEEEESFKLAQKLQAYEEEQKGQEREKQEYEDERLAAKMMLMEDESFRTTTTMGSYSSVHNDNDENEDWTYALQVDKKERMGAIVTQMYQEHARFERIAKRRSNESMITISTTETTDLDLQSIDSFEAS